jgi:hypothetical protein
MNYRLRIAFPALVALCLAASSAVADTASYNASVPLASSNWTTTLAFPKFDPSLGMLLSVSFEVRTDLSATFRFENMSLLSSCASRDSSVARVELQRPDATPITSTIAAREDRRTMPIFDGTLDFGGTSGITVPDLVPA